MLKEIFDNLAKKYGVWRLIQAALAAGCIGLGAAIMLTLAMPIRLNYQATSNQVNNPPGPIDISLKPNVPNFREFAKIIRTGLFKSEISTGGNVATNTTVDRIRSQLKLMAIVDIKGEPTAYVDVKGEGVKRCTVGTTVGNLFTVLKINGTKSIEVDIVGHRQTINR